MALWALEDPFIMALRDVLSRYPESVLSFTITLGYLSSDVISVSVAWFCEPAGCLLFVTAALTLPSIIVRSEMVMNLVLRHLNVYQNDGRLFLKQSQRSTPTG